METILLILVIIVIAGILGAFFAWTLGRWK